MKKPITSSVLALSLTFSSTAFGDLSSSSVLTPEQRQVLSEARQKYGQDWRILNKSVNGEVKTVLLLGEAGRSSTEEDAFTKGLLDHFEHFGIHSPFTGAYENNGYRFKRPHSELAPLGRGTKSVHDLGRFHQRTFGERVEMVTVGVISTAFGRAAVSDLSESQDDSFDVSPVGAALVVAGLATHLVLHLARFKLPRRKNGVTAIARFADHWVQVKPANKVLVAFVLEKYLPRVEKQMIEVHSFEAGQL